MSQVNSKLPELQNFLKFKSDKIKKFFLLGSASVKSTFATAMLTVQRVLTKKNVQFNIRVVLEICVSNTASLTLRHAKLVHAKLGLFCTRMELSKKSIHSRKQSHTHLSFFLLLQLYRY